MGQDCKDQREVKRLVNVYLKTSGDKKNIDGLVVTTLDKGGEAVFR